MSYQSAYTGAQIDAVVGNAVLITEQELTDTQKTQARANIGIVTNPPSVHLPSPPIGTVVADFQAADGYAKGGWHAVGDSSTVTVDTDDYLIGTQSLRFTGVMQKLEMGLDITGKQFRVRYKVNAINSGAYLTMMLATDTTFSTYVSLRLFDTTLPNENSSVKLGEWIETVIPWAACYSPETLANLTTVEVIRFRFSDGAGDANLQLITLDDEPEKKGLVSFTFDDGSSTLMDAAKVLGARNIPATAYIIPSLVGSTGYLTEDEISTLKHTYGWDIEGHSSTLVSLETEEEIANEYSYVKKWIQDKGFGPCDHYAYPGGVHSVLTKKVASRFFTTARTIDSSVLLCESQPEHIVEPYRLRARSGAGSPSYNPEKVQGMIDYVQNYGGWLILVFHHIGSNSGSESAMYCTATNLGIIADYALSSGVEIKTIADVFREV